MARYTCPSCGSSFNGKKCRNCLYATFDEEISHNLHVHKGEPLVIKGPVRRPIPRKDPFGCDMRTRKPRRKVPKLLVWILAVALLEPVLGIGLAVLEDVMDTVAIRTPEAPMPDAVVPEGATQVLHTEDFTLYIGLPEKGQYYPLFLENRIGQDVRLAARSIVADGFLSEQSYAWCDAPAGTLRQGELYLAPEDMQWAVMEAPCCLDVSFAIYDDIEYEDLLEGSFSLDNGGTPHPVVPAGEALAENEWLQLFYLGYFADEYNPEAFYDGQLRFYLENRTESLLSVYSEEVLLNGERMDLNFWCELPENTRTVTRMWLFSAAEQVSQLDQVETLELYLNAYSEELGLMELGWIRISP